MMTRNFLAPLLQATCFAILFSHVQVVHAQLTPQAADRFYDVKDKPLHDALTKLQDVNAGSMELMGTYLFSPVYMKQGLDLAEYFSNPEASKALWVLLGAVESPRFDQLPDGARQRAIGAVEMAVGSGKSEFIPILKRLAHHPNPEVRGAVAMQDVNRYAPSTSLEVLKESILGAMDHLPLQVSGSNGFQEPEFRARWNEFENAVSLYCEFATPSQREEIRPLVETSIKKYGFRFAHFHRPRFDEALSAENGMTVKTMRGKELVVERKRDEVALAAERKRKATFKLLKWGSMILLSIGIIWQVIRKRRQRQLRRTPEFGPGVKL